MIQEIEKCDAQILKFGNIKTKFYRPPFGVTNPNISKAISKTEKISIGWNNRSFDTTNDSKSKIIKRISNQLKKGNIILMHDTSEKSQHVLEDLLLILQKRGFSTFTVENFLNK
jgi:peptidoglycan/xylan/chitin deacetylase (PgdA/CDA1 family)